LPRSFAKDREAVVTSRNFIDFKNRITRRAMLALLSGLLIAGPGRASPKAKAEPEILFVCQFGSVKSAIAREMLRHRAAERGIAIRTFSRGITPEAHVSPQLKARLTIAGIDPDRDKLHRLTARDLRRANMVIVFNRLPASFGNERPTDWTSVGSVSDDYVTSMADIRSRIETLLDSIDSAKQTVP
jgi:protein-tyrosine-phosphatase